MITYDEAVETLAEFHRQAVALCRQCDAARCECEIHREWKRVDREREAYARTLPTSFIQCGVWVDSRALAIKRGAQS